jgi:signal transduction histidine kinase
MKLHRFFSKLCAWLCAMPLSLLLLTGCQGSIGGAAPDLALSKAWRMDPSASASFTLQDAEKATDWQTLPESNTWGFGKETIWVRLQLKAADQDTRTSWVVRVRPAFLDYVTLYDPAAGLVLRSGDAVPPEGEDLSSINFRFQIPPLPYERMIYLQMRSTSARTLHVQVLPYGQDLQQNRLQEWIMGFVMALSVIFATWALVQWIVSRDKVIGAFAVKQFFAASWAFFFLGFARVSIGSGLPEGLLSTIGTMIFVGVISLTIWFFGLLIEGYQPARWALRATQGMAVLVLALPVLHGLGQPHLLVNLINQCVVLGLFLLLIALFSAVPKRVKQPIPMPVFFVYLLVYSSLNALPSLIHLGWVEPHPIVLFSNLAHTVLDGIVMFVMLQIRARALRLAQIQNALDLQHSQQHNEVEKLLREEQDQLFAMLAHEMKTPLATLRMWMEAGQLKPETMERAITDMNAVIERCMHTWQLADQGLQPDWQAVDPLALTRASRESCRSSTRVDLDLPERANLLAVDEQMLSIVLGNLLDNACKYSAPDSRITLMLRATTEDDRAGWCWQVSNQVGKTGLPDAGRLFEKYYRSPQAQRVSGSGLGLFLVKGLLNLMQGRIGYAVRGQQVIFSVWLPHEPRGLQAMPEPQKLTAR